MQFATWQIVLLCVGGAVWLGFEIATIIKNTRAKKAKRENQGEENEP